MRACVIFNPAAGRRRSRRRLTRFLQRWNPYAEFWPTEHPRHAVALAQAACHQGFDIVAAAGGDGTVHEVANGILAARADHVLMAVVPTGSANDYAYSLARQFQPSKLDDLAAYAVDVGVASDSRGRERFFVESLGLCLSAQVTLEARQISKLQGKALYALAVYRALRAHAPQPLVVQFDDDPPHSQNVLLLSALNGRREGGFVLAPAAKLDDGRLDVVCAAPMSPGRVLSMLPRIALAGLPERHPQIAIQQCRSLSVRSLAPLIAHTDGEIFCTPADKNDLISARVLPRRLKVKLCPP